MTFDPVAKQHEWHALDMGFQARGQRGIHTAPFVHCLPCLRNIRENGYHDTLARIVRQMREFSEEAAR